MRIAMLALCIGVSVVGGCEPQRPTGRVTGHVFVNDKPLPDGAIVLMAEDGSYQDSARIRAKGEFRVEAAPVGKVKVGVIVRPAPPPRSHPGQSIAPRPTPVLSAKYADPQKSGLTLDLVEGENSTDVRITAVK